MKAQPPMSDSTLVMMGGLFLAWLAYETVGPTFNRIMAKHPIALVTCCIALAMLLAVTIVAAAWNKYIEAAEKNSVTAQTHQSVYLGVDQHNQPVFLSSLYRGSHAQVIGSTNAGKTESVILPWSIADIENGSGLLIIDGKSDDSFLQKLYAYVCKSGRQKDFRLFSLANLSTSHTFNPLYGANTDQVCERVFNSFPIENTHYKAVQSSIFYSVVSMVTSLGRCPTFALIYRLINEPELMAVWNQANPDSTSKLAIDKLLTLSNAEYSNNTSGLQANIAHFAQGQTSKLFNDETPSIDFDEVLSNNLICYFQLPSMLTPFLGAATGKLALQTFAHAVSRRHLGQKSKDQFFCCYLDDFQDYLYPGFGALLNKSRSANVGIVFSHQALGDLEKVGPHFKNVVVSSTNIKVVMRTIDPDTCDFYARVIGTETTEKVTERQTTGLLGKTKTGEGSAREVEKYVVHPKELRTLERGQGIITIPHPKGVSTVRVRFKMRPNLPAVALPTIEKCTVDMNEIAMPPRPIPTSRVSKTQLKPRNHDA